MPGDARVSGGGTRPATLVRARLEERLDEVLSRRLAVVVAGAGFGKTTLLAAWAERVGAVRYSVTSRDRSQGYLAHGLLEALRRRLGGLPPEVGAGEPEGGAPEGSDVRRAQALASALADAVDAAPERDVVLVLDDLHELDERGASARLVEGLVRLAPPRLHIVLSSRADPPFPIDRLRAEGAVCELDGADLAFTAEEVAQVLRGAGGTRAADVAPDVHRATRGWPAAVRLTVEALQRVEPTDLVAELERLGRPGGPLFEYLAAEALRAESFEVRELLRTVSSFERFSPELCEALGLRGARDTIASLVRRGLFVEPSPNADGWYGLSLLARRFAVDHLALEEWEREDVLGGAARWLTERGHLEDALHAVAGLQDQRPVAEFLGEHGSRLVASGRAELVVRFGERLPRELATQAVDLLLGEAHAVRGDAERALDALHRAAAGSERLPPSVAWRLIQAYSFKDDLEQAVRTYRRADLDDRPPSPDTALLLAWAAYTLWRTGQAEESGEVAARARDVAVATGDARALAAAHGALATAAAAAANHPGRDLHVRTALEAAERAGDLVQLARIHNSRGSMLLEEGNYREALEAIDAAIRTAELAGYPALQALPLMNRGLCQWCLGQLDEAKADYEAAAEMYRGSGSREAAYALIGLGDVFRERGDLAMARTMYEEGLAMGEASGDRQAIVPGLYQLAKVLLAEEPERAAAFAERAVEYGWPDTAWALNASGWIGLARGDRDFAAERAERAAAAARERRDPFGLAEAMELSAMSSADPATTRERLDTALTLWREMGSQLRAAKVELALARVDGEGASRARAEAAERTLRERGVRAAASRAAGLLQAVGWRQPEPVRIQTLGGLLVLREGEPIPASHWRSKKARDLLKILVARRGRAVPKEVAMEALWPEEDPAKSSNRLSVALATVRGVLDPSKRHDAGRFVSSDRDTISLRLSDVVVDLEEFLEAAIEGLRRRDEGDADAARQLLQQAEALYSGDFLEEDLYAEWAGPVREEARTTYLSVARALAADAVRGGDYEAAARYFRRILERDPYDEPAHVGLASALEGGGRHGEARRVYAVYCARMEELGLEPAAFPALTSA